jgi:two-component system cell cycle sensor histidine kinase/response regulator CckA
MLVFNALVPRPMSSIIESSFATAGSLPLHALSNGAWSRRWRRIARPLAVFKAWCLRATRRTHSSDTNEERRSRHDTLEFITSRIPGAVFLWKPTADGTSGHFEYVSTRVRELFGLDPASLRHSRSAFSHVVDEDRDGVREHFRSRLPQRLPVDLEFRVQRGDGAVARVRALANPEQLPNGSWVWTGIYLDITSQRRLEQDLQQAQKLESLGHLAGSVAHDFNNLLTGIFGYLDLLELNLDAATTEVRADLGEIRAAAERASWLTRQLLTFSRKQAVSTRDFDLNEIVRKTERFLGRVLGESVSLLVRPSDLPCHVHADPGQLEQVLLNLAVNARDAMPDGGSIAITTSREYVGEDRAAPGLAPGEYVVLRVKDEGVGMSESALACIFEPYFTTKDSTKGTGIGLAIVYGIVTQAKGAIRVHSAVGVGSIFSVFLPVCAQSAPVEDGPTAESERRSNDCVGTILLVDDNDSVRLVIRRLLERGGLEVVEARNPAEALRIVECRPDPFVLLATDLVMPGMSGKALAARLRERQPDLPVLFLSGSTGESIGEPAADGPRHRFLSKPFLAGELLAAVAALAADRDVRDVHRRAGHAALGA